MAPTSLTRPEICTATIAPKGIAISTAGSAVTLSKDHACTMSSPNANRNVSVSITAYLNTDAARIAARPAVPALRVGIDTTFEAAFVPAATALAGMARTPSRCVLSSTTQRRPASPPSSEFTGNAELSHTPSSSETQTRPPT
ncbi:Uncharacterised protein [Mycobacteroides abscessus subsp. abscessus]|nr:Uncharacterised protein [Mycobacteroides abscessus subsp. abscessus]